VSFANRNTLIFHIQKEGALPRTARKLPNNVRCWEQSGKHLLAVRISFFDPERTWGLLTHARKQFPRDRPSFIFVKAPARWSDNLVIGHL
jgi:hypothetical protein